MLFAPSMLSKAEAGIERYLVKEWINYEWTKLQNRILTLQKLDVLLHISIFKPDGYKYN
jgi:hypothetical protein